MDISDSKQTQDTIRQLAYRWASADLPTHRLVYDDYRSLITRFYDLKGDRENTRLVVLAIIDQASALGKSSEWVEAELSFEALTKVIDDQTVLARLHVEQGEGDDDFLDLYNERLYRFASHD